MAGQDSYVMGLDEISENHIAGEKVMSLATMLREKLPVPEGFVVKTKAYKKFLQENSLESKIRNLIANVNVEDIESLKDVSSQIRNLILNGKVSEDIEISIKDAYEELSIGKDVKEAGGLALDLIKAGSGNRMFVAVRTSVICSYSFAGQTESFLNVSGTRQICEALKKCWASMFSPNAIFYSKHKKIDSVEMSVVVQKMIDSDRAGLILSAYHLAGRPEVLIEASWGLGESIVSGLVTPDEYVIDRNAGSLLSKKINKKLWLRKRDDITGKTVTEGVQRTKINSETLNENELKKLVEMAVSVENIFGCPQTIEWCEQRGKFYLLHARPLVFSEDFPSEDIDSGEVILSGSPASPGVSKGNSKIILGSNNIDNIGTGNIFVLNKAGSEITPYIKNISGIVTDSGGRTSHIASIAREFRIPCIVGAESATTLLTDGQEIVVDGNEGKVLVVRAEEIETIQQEENKEAIPKLTFSDKLTATEIKASLTYPASLDYLKETDGVGILRLETLFLKGKKHPSYLTREYPGELIQLIENSVREVAKASYPKPVFYSFLDVRSDDFRDIDGGEEEQETNPFLGWRGVRRLVDEPEVMRCELRAIKNLHDQGLDNISIIFPFISNIGEFQKIKNHINFPVRCGLMVDTPSTAIEIENFCREGVDFVCIGSDNLIQLLAGVDKDNPKVSRLYSELDPSFIKLVKHIVRTCKKYNIETCFCGEAANNPKLAEILVSAGITSISANPESLEEIRSAVARAERKLLLGRK